jgi:hypothetical protein
MHDMYAATSRVETWTVVITILEPTQVKAPLDAPVT